VDVVPHFVPTLVEEKAGGESRRGKSVEPAKAGEKK
jgi:hypothetical protein